jgi:hypothetical protein
VTLQLIVEGHGEVAAAPVLLRRLIQEAQAYTLRIGRPQRRHRSEFSKKEALQNFISIARCQEECSAILIIFDSDDDCPKTLAPTVEGWAREVAPDIPCAVVLAHREFEAWFLAGLGGIRADVEAHTNPEAPRDAKGALETSLRSRLGDRYSYDQVTEQPAFATLFDLGEAYRRSRSFRRMVRAFGLLVAGCGIQLEQWPPTAWEHH